MNILHLAGNEFRLLLRSNFARVMVVLTVAIALLGMRAVEYANEMQFHGMGRTSLTMSLGAAQYGAMAGAALFAMLTLLVLSRDRRQQCRPVIEAAAGHGRVIAARIVALLALGLTATAMALVATFVSHRVQATAPYEVGPYLFSLGLIMLPAIWLATLIAATMDLVFENLDVAFLLFGAVYFAGFTSRNYLLRWVQTSASVYSDFGGIEPVGRLIVYNRIFWLLLAVAMVLVGFWWRRLPGFPLRVSLARNSSQGFVPLGVLTAIAAAVGVYANEPYLFPADSVFQRDLPRSGQAWLTSVECDVELRPRAKSLTVGVCYEFAKEQAAAQIEFITNKGLKIDSVKVNGVNAAWSRIPRTDRIRLKLPEGRQARVEFHYRGRIRYPVPGGFPGYISNRSVYLLENSHWLFEPLTQAQGPIHVSGSVTAPARLTVVTPGRLESMTENGQTQTWRFAGTCPEFALGLFAAEYACETFDTGSARVEFYFSPRHQAYIQAAKMVDHIRDILAFYQETISPYPFDDMPLKIVETSVYKPGGHASLNVVTIAEYMLNRAKVPDPQNDWMFILRDIKILAHELAHQWWGGAVTVEESGGWSCEGFTEYATYKYIASRYPPTITHNIPGGWRHAVARGTNAYYRKDPGALDRMRPALRERILRGEARDRAYNVLPLQLLAAEERLGEETVRARLAEAFRRSRGGTLDRHDFIALMGPDVIDLEKEQP
jgi:hypothetical protein